MDKISKDLEDNLDMEPLAKEDSEDNQATEPKVKEDLEDKQDPRARPLGVNNHKGSHIHS